MMAMSLDGYVARKNHSLDWLNKQPTQNEDHGFFDFMDSVDALVMGSGSLKTVLGFCEWPYVKPVVVLSRSMTKQELPEHLRDKVEFSRASPQELWEVFSEAGYKRIYVDGGAVIRSFLNAGLVQDMKITMVPILLGGGIRIFGETACDVDLELVSAAPFPSGMVDLVYKLKAS
ncbi:deaminase reductase [Tateyamaria omphalii]|uniref:dihydrofolate reductase family protein n=1 Tax=Tateyamaria omphalii TaxID=299262 RepID=UPI0019ACAB36|nr:dihydrofolate reductase family protein [Tateyamaria omphalii]GGX61082.1 deaminase reductase [Tateyamaria omphalii]